MCAQVITATQMIVEERFVSGSNVSPLHAVGWEGMFGFSILSLLLIPMYFIHMPDGFSGAPDNRLEDAIDAFWQIIHSWQVSTALSGKYCIVF